MEEKARQIAIKYVYGNHDALTDEQEVKDITKDIVDLVKEIEAKNNESLHLVSDMFDFASYVDDKFDYYDNTEQGDIYTNSVTGKKFTEEQIYKDWMKQK